MILKGDFARSLLELRNEMLLDRLALERQHRAERERLLADRPDTAPFTAFHAKSAGKKRRRPRPVVARKGMIGG